MTSKSDISQTAETTRPAPSTTMGDIQAIMRQLLVDRGAPRYGDEADTAVTLLGLAYSLGHTQATGATS